jgi:mannose-6-phosphate isomerase-like protein (cupin superfamily)
MNYATKIDKDKATTPALYESHSKGFRRQILITRQTGSPHMTLSVGHLEPEGHIETTLHSFEFSIYVFSGSLAVTTLGATTLLPPDHCITVPLGTAYSLRSVDGPVEWLQIASPAELDDGRRQDTFFTGETLVEYEPILPDMRDPRNRNAVRFDADPWTWPNWPAAPTSMRRQYRPAWPRPYLPTAGSA